RALFPQQDVDAVGRALFLHVLADVAVAGDAAAWNLVCRRAAQLGHVVTVARQFVGQFRFRDVVGHAADHGAVRQSDVHYLRLPKSTTLPAPDAGAGAPWPPLPLISLVRLSRTAFGARLAASISCSIWF